MIPLREVISKAHKKITFDLGSRYFGRPLSYFLIWLLYPLGITANQISLATIILFIVPCLLISSGSKNLAIIGSLFLLFHIVLDCTDGGMARLRNGKSLRGRYLSYLFHELCSPALFFALSLYSYNYFKSPLMIVLGAATVFSIFTTNVSRLDKHRIVLEHSLKIGRLPLKAQEHPFTSQSSKEYYKRAIFYFIIVFSSVGHLFFILFLMSILGILQYAIIFYSIFYFSIMIIKLFIEIKMGFQGYGLE